MELANRIKQHQVLLNDYRDELQHTRDLNEREQILRIIEGLKEDIAALQEELLFESCYVFPTPLRGLLLKVVGVEMTQSTQFLSIEEQAPGPTTALA